MRILVTDDMRAELQAELRRTGIPPSRIAECVPALPDGVSKSQIYRWLSGEATCANGDAFEACLDLWRSLPDGTQTIDVISELIAELEAEKSRTGIGPASLVKAAFNPPKGMNAAYIKNLLNGRYAMISRERYDWLLATWRALPDAPERVELTDAMVEEIRDGMERAETGPFKLLRGAGSDKPDSLTGSMIQSWVNGTAKTARSDHLDFAQRCWKSMLASRNICK